MKTAAAEKRKVLDNKIQALYFLLKKLILV